MNKPNIDEETVALLIQRMTEVPDSDWYEALVMAGLDETNGDLEKAIALADVAYGEDEDEPAEQPKVFGWDEQAHPRGNKGNPGQFAPKGKSESGNQSKASKDERKGAKEGQPTPSKTKNNPSTGGTKDSGTKPPIFGQAEQQHAEAQQDKLAEAIDRGAKSIPGSAPSDVERTEGGQLIALELKTKLVGKSVRMTPAAQARKALRLIQHKEETGQAGDFHTVAFDHREHYKGNTLQEAPTFPCYYKRGAGSFGLADMHKVESAEELDFLLSSDSGQLPDKAKATDKGFWGQLNKAKGKERQKLIDTALANERARIEKRQKEKGKQ